MKVINNWKQHLKSYSALSLFANVLVSIAYGASLALGIGLATISPVWIVVAMGSIAVMGSVGKFIKQYEEEHPEDE
jgi:hypothetical protein